MDFLLVFVFTAGAQVTSDSGVHTKQFRLLAGESGGGGVLPVKLGAGVRPASQSLYAV